MITVLLVIAAIFGCRKEAPIEAPPFFTPPESKLEHIWTQGLAANRDYGSLSISGFVYENKVYFSDENEAVLKGYNLDGSGEVARLAEGMVFIKSGKQNSFLLGDRLYIISTDDKIQYVNLPTGDVQTVHSGTFAMSNYFVYHDNKIYSEDINLVKNSTFIFSIDLVTHQLDTIMEYERGDWQGRFLPSGVIKCNSRNLFPFQLRMVKPGTPEKRQDYYMYDLDGDSLLWSHVGIDNNEGSVTQAVADDERVYWLGNTSVFALDIETGNLIWEYKNPDEKGHWHGIHFLHNGRYYVKNDGYRFVSLKPETGEIIFENSEVGSTPGNSFEILDGAFCFYSKGRGLFQAIDLNSGHTLLSTAPPVPNASGTYTMASSFVIDQPTRRMYYTNYDDVVCVKIPEWK